MVGTAVDRSISENGLRSYASSGSPRSRFSRDRPANHSDDSGSATAPINTSAAETGTERPTAANGQEKRGVAERRPLPPEGASGSE